ncbi:MAG: ATP-grasp domain-containing protein [Methylovulum sp.]|nr:MAG: ATP-grasp domain-containing protein [Methylovulum sp.]
MKVLIFEYITGGGFNKQELPDALTREGRLMLQALLENFFEINGIELLVMLDYRLVGALRLGNAGIATINPEHDSHEEFARLARQCDAAWPIAPEFDGILEGLCRAVEQDTLLLTSAAEAVAITGNKLLTYQHLVRHHIATVPTELLSEAGFYPGEWMIKSIDGAGCSKSYLITDQQAFDAALRQSGQFIIQPHLNGKKTSLSCLFKQGRAWLLSVNLQRFKIVDRQYQLLAIIVNHNPDSGLYQSLADNIARAFPDLWGYAGIDLIETAEQTLVLEINPRLTTSFAGIHDALGINVAEQVLRLPDGEPDIKAIDKQSISIRVNQYDADA